MIYTTRIIEVHVTTLLSNTRVGAVDWAIDFELNGENSTAEVQTILPADSVIGYYDSIASPVPLLDLCLQIEGGQNFIEFLYAIHMPILENRKTLNTLVPAAITVASAAAKKSEELKRQYFAEIYNDVSYMGTMFQADKYSQDLIVSVLSAGEVPANFYWIDSFNAKIPMTFAELKGLSLSLLVRGQLGFDKLQTKKAELAAAQSIETILAIVW